MTTEQKSALIAHYWNALRGENHYFSIHQQDKKNAKARTAYRESVAQLFAIENILDIILGIAERDKLREEYENMHRNDPAALHRFIDDHYFYNGTETIPEFEVIKK